MTLKRSSFLDVPDDHGDLHRSAIPPGTFCGDDDPPPLPAGVFHGAAHVPLDDDPIDPSTPLNSLSN